MPCMCWYDPPEESKRRIKNLCQQIVDEIHILSKDGDPFGYDIQGVKRLLDHLYNPSSCEERVLAPDTSNVFNISDLVRKEVMHVLKSLKENDGKG